MRIPDPAREGKYCKVTAGRVAKALRLALIGIAPGGLIRARITWRKMTHCERVVYRYVFDLPDDYQMDA